MDLTITQVLVRLFLVGVVGVLGILGLVNFIGMHNNTKDGNTFRLLNPMSLFDPSQFNEEGNRYRSSLLKIFGLSAILGLAFFWVVADAT